MSWVEGKRRWAQGIGLVLSPPDHRAATTGCVGTGDCWPIDLKDVLVWNEAYAGWTEDPDYAGDVGAAVSFVDELPGCTADDALRGSMVHD